jgi:uncharacterized protein (DUF433 family)
MRLTLVEHISVDPKVFRGRPCIRGTRIPVDILVDMRTRDGLSPEEIAELYDGAITLSDVYAAFSYYFDHREEIDRMVAQADAWSEEFQRQYPNGSVTAGTAGSPEE